MEDLDGHVFPQLGIALEDALDIQQILTPFAGTAPFIGSRPDLSLQDVLDSCDRKRDAQHVARFGALHEGKIAGIGLQLHPQVGAGSRHVEAVREPFHLKTPGQQCFCFASLPGCDHQSQIQTDQRLHVRINALTANYAIADTVLLEEGDQ
jgi:hypothetical protein